MKLDIHAHHVSDELVEAVRNAPDQYGARVERNERGEERLLFGDGRVTRPVFPGLRQMDLRLAAMADGGVDVQVVSTWMDLVGYWIDMPRGARFARLQNDTIARTCRVQPDRLMPMATVPLQHVPAAVDELDYCSKQLGMRAVELGTNINGQNLDEPAFDPFWRKAQELDLLVFLHPVDQIGGGRMDRYWLFNTVGNPTETTLAATSLIYGGVLDRFPALKICLAHAGGFLPYQIGRYDRAYEMHEVCRGCAQPPSAYLNRFYYDTISFNTRALEYLADTVTPERILLGTDYPFAFSDPESPSRVAEMRNLTDEQREGIYGGNGRRALGLEAE